MNNPFLQQTYSERFMRRRRITLAVTALVLAAFAVFACVLPLRRLIPAATLPEKQEGELRVHFLPVSGECTVVEFPDGEALVIDGGGTKYESERLVFRYLNAIKPQKLSVLLTQADKEQYGGLEEILRSYPVERLYLPAVGVDTVGYRSIISVAKDKKIESKVLTRYGQIEQAGVSILCLSPHANAEEVSNDTSTVLHLSYQGVNVLLCGNISAKTERALMREYGLGHGVLDGDNHPVVLENTSVMHVSHHGTADSSCEAWLALLDPEEAIVSMARGNPHFHPSEAAIKRLTAAGIKINRTDELGVITLSVCDGSYSISGDDRFL